MQVTPEGGPETCNHGFHSPERERIFGIVRRLVCDVLRLTVAQINEDHKSSHIMLVPSCTHYVKSLNRSIDWHDILKLEPMSTLFRFQLPETN